MNERKKKVNHKMKELLLLKNRNNWSRKRGRGREEEGILQRYIRIRTAKTKSVEKMNEWKENSSIEYSHHTYSYTYFLFIY